MKVFFTRSENLKIIPPQVSLRICKVVGLNAEILVGNFSDFDEIALGILFILEYPRVTVYQSGNKDNLGYPSVDVGEYPASDIAMSEEANFMLAVCDGKSPRVTANLQRMPKNRIRLIRL
ncbi:hypothetical protein QUA54_18655 [Microcoleus sp. MOSTC5]|uniref:hypothetical protein n=1 Tax=Microcoleus sp. MOSTC5 TaxID=3055378 RepID=UPI002FCF6974